MAKGFQFRFESLLQLRRQELERAGNEVSDAERAIDILRQQAEEISAERAALRTPSDPLQGAQTLSVDRLLNQGRYDMQLIAQLQDLATKTEQIQHERERRLTRLRDANAEVRRLERLKERQQDQWRLDQLAAEQAVLDDIAAGRFLRQARLNARLEEVQE